MVNLMLFRNLRKLQEVEEEEDDIVYEENEVDEYEQEEIKDTIAELTEAVSTMKVLVMEVLEKDSDSIAEDTQAIKMATEIFQSHLKISWDDSCTPDVLPTLKKFESIQNHLKEINYKFVHLEISEFRYELLRNILVAKLTSLIKKILSKVY